jgi:hypothetical protein
MPKDFLRCIADGGKVVTHKLSNNRYVRLCKDKKGKWHSGEVKKKRRTE